MDVALWCYTWDWMGLGWKSLKSLILLFLQNFSGNTEETQNQVRCRIKLFSDNTIISYWLVLRSILYFDDSVVYFIFSILVLTKLFSQRGKNLLSQIKQYLNQKYHWQEIPLQTQLRLLWVPCVPDCCCCCCCYCHQSDRGVALHVLRVHGVCRDVEGGFFAPFLLLCQ